jgi:hypothetical protein
MTKHQYLVTGIISLLAFILLLILFYLDGLTEPTFGEAVTRTAYQSAIERENFIALMRTNYAIDSFFIFCWIGAWAGIYSHFRRENLRLVAVYFALGILGALMDLLENTIGFSLVLGMWESSSDLPFFHSVVREFSYWLPMAGVFILALLMRGFTGFPTVFFRLVGIVGVGIAAIGMYIPALKYVPSAWFAILFLAKALYLIDIYKNQRSTHQPRDACRPSSDT